MAFDRNAIDQTRKLQNLPPITDEEFASLNGNGLSEEEKAAQIKAQADKKKLEEDAAAEIERQRLAAEEEKNKPKELTDEELMARIAEKTGRKVSSWDDLKPTAEVIDKEKAKEERENDKFTWGLKTKQFKKSQYEGFIADSKDAKDLVYRQRLQAALKDDPALDEAEFKSEFEEEFGLDAKPETRRFKNGQDTLNRLANDILKSTYAPIYELDSKYSQYEQQQMAQAANEQKVKEGAPAFRKTLNTIKGQLKKIKTQFGDNEEYEVELLDESIDKVINMMSDPQWASTQILNGYSEEGLKDVAWTAVLKENFPVLAKKIADQHLLRHAAGVKGVLKVDTGSKTEDTEILTDQQQIMKNLIEADKAKQPAGALN